MSSIATSVESFVPDLKKYPRLAYRKFRDRVFFETRSRSPRITASSTSCSHYLATRVLMLMATLSIFTEFFGIIRDNIPNTGTVLGIIFLCVIRDIVLDIEKYAFTVIGIKSLILLGIIPIIFSCYYQAFTFKLESVGINFLLENESITISFIVL